MLNRLVTRSGTCGINRLSLSDLEGVELPDVHPVRPRWGRCEEESFSRRFTSFTRG